MDQLTEYDLYTQTNNAYYKSLLKRELDLKVKLGLPLPNQMMDAAAKRLKGLEEQYALVKSKEKALKRKDLFWITINPKPGVTLKALKEQVQQVCSKRCFKYGYYTFEQRGKTLKDMGKGVHCHLAMVRLHHFKPAPIRQAITKKLLKADIIGNAMAFDLRPYPMSWLKEKLEYMSGTKWDEEKDDAVEINKKWRVQNGLKNIYSHNITDATSQASKISS